jgi:hypothetical protein
MRFGLYSLLALFVFASPLTAHADMPEAKEVARINNCPPKKIEVYQQSLGSEGKTIYRVECTLPKTVGGDGSAPKASALLISCDDTICTLLRPVMNEKK